MRNKYTNAIADWLPSVILIIKLLTNLWSGTQE